MATDFFARPNGQVQDGGKDIPESDGSTNVGYDYSSSLDDANMTDVMEGYIPEGSITADTKSDAGFA